MTTDFLVLPKPPWFLATSVERSALDEWIWRLGQQLPEQSLVRVLRGSRMRSFPGFFQEIAAAFQFPYYFGSNFNALSECLSDLSWLPAPVYVLVVEDAANVLVDETRGDVVAFVRLLRDLSIEWGEPIALNEPWDRPARPFHTVLHARPGEEAALQALLRDAGEEAVEVRL